VDPFEEFEMKPITQGLGFHKKAIKLNDTAATPNTSSSLVKEAASAAAGSYSQFLESLKKPDVTTPLPRDQNRENLPSFLTTEASNEMAGEITWPNPQAPTTPNRPKQPTRPNPAPGNFKKSVDLDFVDPKVAKKIPATEDVKPSRSTLVEIPFSFSAAVVDTIVLIALTLVFLICVLMITKVNLISIVQTIRNDSMTQLSLVLLMLALYQIYSVVARSTFGATIGEWTFDLQLGHFNQHEMSTYPLRVAWRSLAMILTGFVVLPFLSLVFRRDLAGKLSGLQLYRQI
jgi:hypothetical protein